MNNENQKDLMVWGPAIFVVLVLCLLINCIGCRHCTPKIQTEVVQVPVYSCPEPPQVPEVQLPSFPEPPGAEATEQEIKEWYADMEGTARLRERMLKSQVLLLQSIVDKYRETPENPE